MTTGLPAYDIGFTVSLMLYLLVRKNGVTQFTVVDLANYRSLATYRQAIICSVRRRVLDDGTIPSILRWRGACAVLAARVNGRSRPMSASFRPSWSCIARTAAAPSRRRRRLPR